MEPAWTTGPVTLPLIVFHMPAPSVTAASLPSPCPAPDLTLMEHRSTTPSASSRRRQQTGPAAGSKRASPADITGPHDVAADLAGHLVGHNTGPCSSNGGNISSSPGSGSLSRLNGTSALRHFRAFDYRRHDRSAQRTWNMFARRISGCWWSQAPLGQQFTPKKLPHQS